MSYFQMFSRYTQALGVIYNKGLEGEEGLPEQGLLQRGPQAVVSEYSDNTTEESEAF